MKFRLIFILVFICFKKNYAQNLTIDTMSLKVIVKDNAKVGVLVTSKGNTLNITQNIGITQNRLTELLILLDKIAEGSRQSLFMVDSLRKFGDTEESKDLAGIIYTQQIEHYIKKYQGTIEKQYIHINKAALGALNEKRVNLCEIEDNIWFWYNKDINIKKIAEVLTKTIEESDSLDIVATAFYAWEYFFNEKYELFNFDSFKKRIQAK